MNLRKWKRGLKHLLLKLSLIPPIDSAYVDLEYVYYQPVRHEITVELPVSLSGEDIDEIMSKALCDGILRWCKEVTAQGQYPGKMGIRDRRCSAPGAVCSVFSSSFSSFERYFLVGPLTFRDSRKTAAM